MQIYYVQNKKQYLSLLVRLINDDELSCDNFELAGIKWCTYDKDNEIYIDWEQCCSSCEFDVCLLGQHINDKDVQKHIVMNDNIISEYPVIVVINEDYIATNQWISFIPVSQAKNNIKYGYGY